MAELHGPGLVSQLHNCALQKIRLARNMLETNSNDDAVLYNIDWLHAVLIVK